MNYRICSIAAGLIALLSSTPSLAADVLLRVSLEFSRNSLFGENFLSFTNEVSKKSQGEIKFSVFDAGQIHKPSDGPSAVKKGLISISAISLERYANTIPAVDIFNLPFLLDRPERARASMTAGSAIRGPIDEAIRRENTTVLWWMPQGESVLISNAGNITIPANLSDKNVAVPNDTMGEFVAAVGGNPIKDVGFAPVTALESGIADVGMSNILDVARLNMWRSVDSVTATGHAKLGFVVVINSDDWSKLSKPHKDILEAAALSAETYSRNNLPLLETNAYNVAQKNNMKVIKLNADMIEIWRRAALQNSFNNYVQTSGDVGQEIIDRMTRDEENEWGCCPPRP